MLSVRSFGSLPDGRLVEAYTLANAQGHRLEVLTYGGIVRTHHVPLASGRTIDVVQGYADLAGYLRPSNPYTGAIIGRVAGRVPGGRLLVGGHTLPVARNEHGRNHTHGGYVGLDKRLWSAQGTDQGPQGATLRLCYFSPAGEEGYPGNVDLHVTYMLDAAGTFTVATAATTDAPTPLSLAHHAYYNLSGETAVTIEDHDLQVWAENISAVDAQMTPLNQRLELDGSPADLRRAPRRLREVIPQLHQQHGDLYFLHLPKHPRPASPTRVAQLHAPATGLTLQVHTDEACLQVYLASAHTGEEIGKSGRPYARHSAICFECQGFPGATEHPEWGDIIVRPGETQRRTTRYHFSAS
jgi:aldose 1-epimerase